MWGEGVGIEYCVHCRKAIFEDEKGVLSYFVLGPMIFDSRACIEAFKGEVERGKRSVEYAGNS